MSKKLDKLKYSLSSTLLKAVEKERERYKDGLTNEYIEIEEFALGLLEIINNNRHDIYEQQVKEIRSQIYREQQEERKREEEEKARLGL